MFRQIHQASIAQLVECLLTNNVVWGSNLHQNCQNFPKLSLPLGLSKSNLGPNVAKSINTHGQTVNPWRK
jgi:hypothetical protein